MLSDIHCICGYLIAKFLHDKNAFITKSATLSASSVSIHRLHSKSKRLFGGIGRGAAAAGSSNKRMNHLWQGLEILVAYFARKRWMRYLKRVIFSILEPLIPSSFESKYILLACILANLPDIDVLVSLFFKQLGLALQRSGISLSRVTPLRRTWTHSLLTNAVSIPIVSLLVKFIMLGSNRITYRNALALTSLCTLSHLLLDYTTSYGAALFFPYSKRCISLGIISEWDFVTYVYFYSWFSAMYWRHPSWRKSRILLYGTVGYFALTIWRRAMLCEVYQRAHFFMSTLRSRKLNRLSAGGASFSHQSHASSNVHVWLQPSNILLGKYTVMTYDANRHKLFKSKAYTARRFLSILEYMRGWLLFVPHRMIGHQRPDFRVPTLSQEMGKLQAIPAPKEFYERIPVLWIDSNSTSVRSTSASSKFAAAKKKKRGLLFTLLMNGYAPTILFVLSYHLVSFLARRIIARRRLAMKV